LQKAGIFNRVQTYPQSGMLYYIEPRRKTDWERATILPPIEVIQKVIGSLGHIVKNTGPYFKGSYKIMNPEYYDTKGKSISTI